MIAVVLVCVTLVISTAATDTVVVVLVVVVASVRSAVAVVIVVSCSDLVVWPLVDCLFAREPLRHQVVVPDHGDCQ